MLSQLHLQPHLRLGTDCEMVRPYSPLGDLPALRMASLSPSASSPCSCQVLMLVSMLSKIWRLLSPRNCVNSSKKGLIRIEMNPDWHCPMSVFFDP